VLPTITEACLWEGGRGAADENYFEVLQLLVPSGTNLQRPSSLDEGFSSGIPQPRRFCRAKRVRTAALNERLYPVIYCELNLSHFFVKPTLSLRERILTMILGLELAFAIVPLVVKATEYHEKAYRKLKMIASPKARDEELEDFLADLHDEVSLLGHTLRCLISDLTTLTEKQRERLLNLDREQWKQDNVSVALRTRLGDDAEIAFTDILSRLLKCLDDVVSEKSLRFIRSDVVSGSF
jgi:hypothetical protein